MNRNKRLNITPIEFQQSLSVGKRRGSLLESQLSKRRFHRHDELILGELGCLGSDNLFEILTRLDVHSLHSCLRVNKTLATLITAPTFRGCWRGRNVVLIGSRTLPWRLLSTHGDSQEATGFLPLNTPRCPGLVVASAGGLLCISLYPKNEVLQLIVGNPLTHDWIALPLPSRSFGDIHYRYPSGGTGTMIRNKLSFEMEVFEGGHFKVSAQERLQWLHQVFVYDSVSDSWGKTMLYYPGDDSNDSNSRWSTYDLTADRWRVSVIGGLGRNVIATGVEKLIPEEVHALSQPLEQGFCVWEYKSTTYFASPWARDVHRSISGYGVWKLKLGTSPGEGEELIPVSIRHFEALAPHVRNALYLNDMRFGNFTSCHAFQNLVCFMAESLVHPPVLAILFDIDTECWSIVKDHIPPELPFTCSSRPGVVEACDHTSVALSYTPTVLAPAVNRVTPPPTPGRSRRRKRHVKLVR